MKNIRFIFAAFMIALSPTVTASTEPLYCSGNNRYYDSCQCNDDEIKERNFIDKGTGQEGDGWKCVKKGADTEPQKQNTGGTATAGFDKKAYDNAVSKYRKEYEGLENKLLDGGYNNTDEFNQEVDNLISKCTSGLRSINPSAESYKVCGDYRGFPRDGIKRNANQAIEKFNKQQQNVAQNEERNRNAATESAIDVTGALQAATAAVNENNNQKLKSAAADLKKAVNGLKKTVGRGDSNVRFQSLTSDGNLKSAATALGDALQKQSTENVELRTAANNLGAALQGALASKDATELAAALDKAAAALDEASVALKREIKAETAAEKELKKQFEKITERFKTKIAAVRRGE